MDPVVYVLIFWLAPIGVSGAMGRAKNRTGWLYGLLAGWLGVIILACLGTRGSDKYGECPFCREDVRLDAVVCPHCRRDLEPALPTR